MVKIEWCLKRRSDGLYWLGAGECVSKKREDALRADSLEELSRKAVAGLASDFLARWRVCKITINPRPVLALIGIRDTSSPDFCPVFRHYPEPPLGFIEKTLTYWGSP